MLDVNPSLCTGATKVHILLNFFASHSMRKKHECQSLLRRGRPSQKVQYFINCSK